MLKDTPGERRFLILLILVGLMFPPVLLVYVVYRLFRNAVAGSLDTEGLVVGAFLVAMALFGSVAWAGALNAVFG